MIDRSFNSRLREEATQNQSITDRLFGVSTHASVRRRQLSVSNQFMVQCFNSRLREEATNVVQMVYESHAVSTHASVRRRLRLVIVFVVMNGFQLTPP